MDTCCGHMTRTHSHRTALLTRAPPASPELEGDGKMEQPKGEANENTYGRVKSFHYIEVGDMCENVVIGEKYSMRRSRSRTRKRLPPPPPAALPLARATSSSNWQVRARASISRVCRVSLSAENGCGGAGVSTVASSHAVVSTKIA